MVTWMKAALRIIGLTGLVIFCLMCSVTFLSPITFERAAKALIQRQVESNVRKTLDGFDGSFLEKVSRHLSAQNEAEISEIRKSLNDRFPEKIASIKIEEGTIQHITRASRETPGMLRIGVSQMGCETYPAIQIGFRTALMRQSLTCVRA